jgi:hypothetical protein
VCEDFRPEDGFVIVECRFDLASLDSVVVTEVPEGSPQTEPLDEGWRSAA